MVERLSSGNHPGPPPPPQQPVHTVPHHTSMTSTQMPSLRQQPSAASPTAALPSFYKRPLPASCVAFDSTEGKQLFRKAMQEGNMENYFALAQSFLTQNEPAYCGLATLCMILNALGVDPQKQFKGPWRYYSQEMLDCCRTLDDVAKAGITLSEFSCLARCNGLQEYTRYGTMVTLEEFEADIERVCGQDDGSVMAVSYSRKSLGQTGDGHFSPVGGYCKAEKRVLILDVARFKYPSYWVSLEDLFESLKPIDKATSQPRGYAILRTVKSKNLDGGKIVDLPVGLHSLNFNKQSWPAFLSRVRSFTGTASSVEAVVSQILQLLQAEGAQPLQHRKITQDSIEQAQDQQQLDPVPTKLLSDAYEAELQQLVSLVKTLPLWRQVNVELYKASQMQQERRASPGPPSSVLPAPPALDYTLFLLAFCTSPSVPARLREICSASIGSGDLSHLPEKVQQEVRFLQDQMASLEKCCSSEKACACIGKGSPGTACPNPLA